MDEGLNNNSIGKTPISQRKTIKGICYGQFLSNTVYSMTKYQTEMI